MITLFILLLGLGVLALLVLLISGIIAIAWPLAIILAVGVLIDCLVLRGLVNRKKK